MPGRELDVWCFGRVAGRLTDDGTALRFAYDRAWLADDRPPLSQALPLDGSFDERAVTAFFEGLLPEGRLRRIVAGRFGVSETNPFSLLARAARAPARELPRLLDTWALSFLAANHDAHAKNFSLLYRPTGTELAPVYDVLNTIDYRGVKPMDRKMAMKVGGEGRPPYVRRRHLERMISEAGLGWAPARRRMRKLAEQAIGAVPDARAELVASAWDDPQLDKLVARGEQRATCLIDALDAR